jgi:hypothetical protein
MKDNEYARCGVDAGCVQDHTVVVLVAAVLLGVWQQPQLQLVSCVWGLGLATAAVAVWCDICTELQLIA